jgi:hypothetical protein
MGTGGRHTRRWSPIAAGLALAMAMAAPAAAAGCDRTAEAVRSGPGAPWTISGAEPSVIEVTADGERVTWSLTTDDYAVATVTSESLPAPAHSTTGGSVVDIGSALQVREGTPTGSVEGAARVTLCLTEVTPDAAWISAGPALLIAGATAVAVATLAVARRLAVR